MYKHFSQVIDSLDIDGLFPLNFDFAAYYEAFHETEDTIAMQVCKKKYNEFVKNYGKYKPWLWTTNFLLFHIYSCKCLFTFGSSDIIQNLITVLKLPKKRAKVA